MFPTLSSAVAFQSYLTNVTLLIVYLQPTKLNCFQLFNYFNKFILSAAHVVTLQILKLHCPFKQPKKNKTCPFKMFFCLLNALTAVNPPTPTAQV